MATGFTKLFSSIITSSIWGEDDKTRIMWITMLATADATGHVDGSVPGMATVARMSIPEAEAAIHRLLQPDPYSRTTAHEGRRLEEVEGGWQILNYAFYREKGRSQDRKEYYRQYNKARKRAHRCAPLRTAERRSTPNAEAEADIPPIVPQGTVRAEFEQDFWPNVPTKIGKGKAREAYLKARKKTDKATILAGLPGYFAYEGKRAAQADYRPLHPATWLNQERWADEPTGNAKPHQPPAVCACGCGKEPTIQRDNKWWASSQCFYTATKE
jgi:hypothetical protein